MIFERHIMKSHRTATEVAAILGASEERVRLTYRKDAEQLAKMAAKATRSGRKVNGYTAEQLNETAFRAALLAVV